MRGVSVESEEKIRALKTTLTELSRIQGLARSVDETFVAFLIASAQRETGTRINELAETTKQTSDAPA